jgi:hypothetical protein
MTVPASNRLFQHPGRPEWGRGLLVAERDKLLVIHWEDGKEHLVAATHRDRLDPVQLPTGEEGVLAERIRGMQARSTAPAARAKKSSARSASKTAVPPPTWAAQLAAFEAAFPGGFAGEPFTTAERGAADGEGTVAWAIARASDLLAPGRFGESAALFDAIVAFLRPPLDLVHPMEGAIPLKSMKDPEARAAFIAALRDLLHGDGPYQPRFDRYVAAIQVAQKDGKIKRPGWPLSTLLPALARPGERLFVKPQLWQKQAAILGLKINYQSAPSGAVYDEFLAVSRALDARLREAGQKPRDLLDVAAFVATTLSPGQAAHVSLLPPPVADAD